MIFGYSMLIIINVAFYLGGIQEIPNAMNVGEFVLWIMACFVALGCFAPDNMIPVTNRVVRRIVGAIATTITILHAVYWGFTAAPVLWTVAYFILFARKSELIKQSK